jgi:NADH pyrophosphatase NudC (nudix superfamily)
MEFHPQTSEVSEVKWFNRAEINQLIDKHPETVATGLTLSLEHYK